MRLSGFQAPLVAGVVELAHWGRKANAISLVSSRGFEGLGEAASESRPLPAMQSWSVSAVALCCVCACLARRGEPLVERAPAECSAPSAELIPSVACFVRNWRCPHRLFERIREANRRMVERAFVAVTCARTRARPLARPRFSWRSGAGLVWDPLAVPGIPLDLCPCFRWIAQGWPCADWQVLCCALTWRVAVAKQERRRGPGGPSVGGSVGRVVGRVGGRSVGWSRGRLGGRAAGRSVGR